MDKIPNSYYLVIEICDNILYFFMLCMENWLHIILKNVQKDLWKPIKASKCHKISFSFCFSFFSVLFIYFVCKYLYCWKNWVNIFIVPLIHSKVKKKKKTTYKEIVEKVQSRFASWKAKVANYYSINYILNLLKLLKVHICIDWIKSFIGEVEKTGPRFVLLNGIMCVLLNSKEGWVWRKWNIYI